MSMAKPTVRIENVVASVTLSQRVDLEAVAREVPGVEYNPEQFPGLVYRLKKPKTATLIFGSGKMVCTGAKSEKDVLKAVKKIVSNLKKYEILVTGNPKTQIQNIVASANLMTEVDLERAVFMLDNVMYEPEQFPGLIFRMDVPHVVLLIFSSGKMVCTGAKMEEQVYEAVNKIHGMLREFGVLYHRE